MFKIIELDLPGVFILNPLIISDRRGDFTEIYKEEEYQSFNFPNFVQDNVSSSKKNVIRGFHFQLEPFHQAKLVTAITGKIFDVIADIRPSSPMFGKHISTILDSKKRNLVFIPPGFAHAFCTLSEESTVLYKNSSVFHKEYYTGIRWNDPDLAVKWPTDNPIISEKDKELPFLKDLLSSDILLSDVD